MRIVLFVAYLVGAVSGTAHAQPITTFILVRHAEKADDGTNDPPLTPEGQARARRLAELLVAEKVTVILSTDFKRTRQTVEPVAGEKGLAVQSYSSIEKQDLQALVTRYRGGTILVAGHSGTTPVIANRLLGKEIFKAWNDDDYGNILVVSVTAVGDDAKVVTLRY